MAGVTDLSLNTSRVTILFLLFIAVAGVVIYLDYPKQELTVRSYLEINPRLR
jgi:hypothetical protein